MRAARRLLSALVLAVATAAAAACSAPTTIAGGPPIAAPAIAEGRVEAADGARLPLRAWLPEDGSARAVIVALHGFNMHAGIFEAAGRWLSDRGVAVYAYDQRGFGGAPNRGLWAGTGTLVDDATAVVAAIRDRHPATPVYLMGDSMGGAIAIVASASAPSPQADGVILVAPAVWGRASMPWYQTAALWFAVNTVPDGIVTGRGMGVVASDNTERLRTLGRDPLVNRQSRIDMVWGLVNLMDQAMAVAPGLDDRMLVLWGERDQLIPGGAVREMLQRLPAEAAGRQRVAIYPEGWHMLLNDLQAEVVFADVLAWIETPRAPLPSGADRRAAAWRACPPEAACAIVPPSAERNPTG